MKNLRVPEDRIGLFKKEEMKRFETYTETKINYNEDTKTVEISNSSSIEEFRVKDALSSLIYGFDFSDAYSIVDDDSIRLQIIDMSDHTRNKKELERQKGRLIGENGKSKKTICKLADVKMRIYRDKVAIIGSVQDVTEARTQILRLISGSPHSSVYEKLEKYNARKVSESISYTINN